jgi:hypothetical protein
MKTKPELRSQVLDGEEMCVLNLETAVHPVPCCMNHTPNPIQVELKDATQG